VCCSVLQSRASLVAVCCVHCSAFQCAMCCSALQCVVVHRSVLQCVAVCCRMWQCVAAWSSALQHVAACCSVKQCIAVCCSALQFVQECCDVLLCIVVCGSVLHCVAVATGWQRWIGYFKMQVSFRKRAIHCRALLRNMLVICRNKSSYALFHPVILNCL